MPDLTHRSREPEALDLGVPDDEVRRSLADLRFVNRWLGARRRLLDAVGRWLPPGGRLLDVGCGSADLPAWLRATLPGPMLAVGLDVKLQHLRHAPSDLPVIVADVRRLPFGPGAFDVVTASLFLHHFDTDELPGLIARLYALARRALIVSDLHRAYVPHLVGRVAFPVVFRSPVSVADGLVSIRRGFRAAELSAAFAAAGIPDVEITRRFPYRLLAVATR